MTVSAAEAKLAKRLVERGYVRRGQTRSVLGAKVREMLRGMADAGGILHLGEAEGEAFAELLGAATHPGSREMLPAEADAIERFFARVEVTLAVKLRK